MTGMNGMTDLRGESSLKFVEGGVTSYTVVYGKSTARTSNYKLLLLPDRICSIELFIPEIQTESITRPA
jgi:hypothetical protein